MNHSNSKINNNRNQAKSATTEIMKRPLKERLIHLLALRPYKKPELIVRIKNDGLKERDRTAIATALKSVSFLRENTYHLHRHMWNDVHEDWPFYTEQDRQTLKRRKPQNLTPPVSSDGGSSTSGQSPTSTHNGSPPPAVKRPPLNNEIKYLDGPANKKSRISHYRKEAESSNRRSDSREATMLNSRSRENEVLRSSSNYYGSNNTPNALDNDDNDMSMCISYDVITNEAVKRMASNSVSTNNNGQDHNRDNRNHHNIHNNHNSCHQEKESDDDTDPNINNINSVSGNPSYDFSKFTPIMSIDQRRQYKTEFDNDFAEYRKMHADLEVVSKRFTELSERLKNEKNYDRRKEIKSLIFNEYQNNQKKNHQEKKQKFHYLHQKLSHIKRLVHDYDMTITNGAAIAQATY